MAAATKILDEAMKLPPQDRVRVAEKLLESADAEGYQDDEPVDATWAQEIQRRARELHDGSVRGLTVEEARHIVASDTSDDER